MFLGILIGMVIYGLVVLISNTDSYLVSQETRATRIKLRIAAWLFIIIGACGAVGWILEVCL